MDARDVVRTGGIVAVAAVDGVTGWLSYWHIVWVVTRHGEPGVSGHLFPVIIDGTLMASSSVLMNHAQQKTEAPRWAWAAAITATSSTIAFNVLFGVTHGWLSALIAALVSVMMLFCIELLLALVRGVVLPGHVATADTTAVILTPDTQVADTQVADTQVADTTPGTVTPDIGQDDEAADSRTPDTAPRGRTPRQRTAPSKPADKKLADIFAENPDITGAELARQTGMNPRTAQRKVSAFREQQEARAAAGTPPLTQKMLEAA